MDDPAIHALLPAVEDQLLSAETPFVAATLEGLLKQEDIEEAEARYMIAFCLADEAEKMANEERDFDLERYRTLLSLLPVLPE